MSGPSNGRISRPFSAKISGRPTALDSLQTFGATMSALPPKADLFHHWRLCPLMTLSGHSVEYSVQQVGIENQYFRTQFILRASRCCPGLKQPHRDRHWNFRSPSISQALARLAAAGRRGVRAPGRRRSAVIPLNSNKFKDIFRSIILNKTTNNRQNFK